ncbi:MAG TPA: hypothetical protein VLB68_11645 [Pyrinomonadaceae bacterium]|nr:hypothetical protein [Pyrinomonadaceae bacterium]
MPTNALAESPAVAETAGDFAYGGLNLQAMSGKITLASGGSIQEIFGVKSRKGFNGEAG